MTRLDLGAVFADAARQWRGDRDLLLRVAGVFFFLPALAFALVAVQMPADPDATIEQSQAALVATFEANLPWMAASSLVQEFGVLVLLLMLLGPGPVPLGTVLRRALRLFPGYVLLVIATGLAVFCGTVLLIVPGLYLQGRTLLNGPAYAAHAGGGPVNAFARGVRLARGHGWLLLLLGWAMPVVATFLVNAIWQGLGDPLIAASGDAAPVRAAVMAGVAAVGTAGSLALTLVRASAYRLLVAGARQGT